MTDTADQPECLPECLRPADRHHVRQIAKAKADLLPAADRAALEETYGKIIGPLIDAKLEAKAVELVERFRQAQLSMLTAMLGDVDADRASFLVDRDKVAELLDVSLSTVKRMEADGYLPEPIGIGERGVRHRRIDIERIAKTKAKL